MMNEVFFSLADVIFSSNKFKNLNGNFLSLHLDVVQLSRNKFMRDKIVRALRNSDCCSVLLVQSFQARAEVHGVAHCSIIKAFKASHVSNNCIPRIQPDSYLYL